MPASLGECGYVEYPTAPETIKTHQFGGREHQYASSPLLLLTAMSSDSTKILRPSAVLLLDETLPPHAPGFPNDAGEIAFVGTINGEAYQAGHWTTVGGDGTATEFSFRGIVKAVSLGAYGSNGGGGEHTVRDTSVLCSFVVL